MTSRAQTGPAAATAALDEVRRWEHAAAARLDAENRQAQRLEQARQEAADLLRAARQAAETSAERHRSERLARARQEADEVRAAGRRSAAAVEEELRRRMPDLVERAVALVVPVPLPATPRQQA